MGFRFHNLNLICKSLSAKCLIFPDRNGHLNRSIQAFGFRLQEPSLILFENPNYTISRRWHVGHSHHHHHHDRSGKEGENIFRLGLAADVGLAAGKALTGYLSGSTAIIADAVHSVSDVVLSSVALLSFKVARAPKDKEHPYGHGKFETLGALGISGMLLLTAGGIAWHAFDILLGLLSATPEAANQSLQEHVHGHHHGGHHHGIDMDHPILALNMTILSICVKEGLYWLTKRAGEKAGSSLMKANAWHHRADAVSSVVALIGVGGSILGVKFLDPLAGLIVSGMILKAGVETGYHSVLELADAAVPFQCLDPIKQTILQVEGVKGCHRLRGRKAGSSLYLDVHIEVDSFSSVSAAHDVGEHVRKQIHAFHPEVAEVFIHIDPAISGLPPDMKEKQENSHMSDPLECDQKHIGDAVCSIFSSKFSEGMVVEHITCHRLQGKILLQVEVSMPRDILIRDAMEMADEAKVEILKVSSDILEVSILLHLQHPVPQFRQSLNKA